MIGAKWIVHHIRELPAITAQPLNLATSISDGAAKIETLSGNLSIIGILNGLSYSS